MCNQRRWAKKMVDSSRVNDKKFGRYTAENYVTSQFCEDQMKKQNEKCYHCAGTMLYGEGVNRQTTREAATIERLDNARGHTQDNCVLCCRKCQGVNHPRTKQ